MNKNYILATGLGIIIGIGGTYLYLNKKYILYYKDEYEEEPIEDKEKENNDVETDLEIKVHEGYYSEDEEPIENKDEDEDDVEEDDYDDDDMFVYDEENSNDFVIIDASEFGDNKSYDKESYTYIISTAHLYDSYSFLIEDIQEEIGEEAASMLEEYSGNEIFLRDDQSKVYIHIVKVNE